MSTAATTGVIESILYLTGIRNLAKQPCIWNMGMHLQRK
jgi:hypothetical protein